MSDLGGLFSNTSSDSLLTQEATSRSWPLLTDAAAVAASNIPCRPGNWQTSRSHRATCYLLTHQRQEPTGWSYQWRLGLSGDRLALYTELYSDDPTTLDGMQVRIEVTESASGGSLVTGTGVLELGDRPTSRIVSAIVPIDTLPPGRYVARMVVTRDDESLAQLSRPFHVTRPLAPGVTSTPGLASAAPDAMMPAAASQDVVRGLLGDALAFQGAALLSTEVVGFFMDRVDENRPALKAVTSEVRAGNLNRGGPPRVRDRRPDGGGVSARPGSVRPEQVEPGGDAILRRLDHDPGTSRPPPSTWARATRLVDVIGRRRPSGVVRCSRRRQLRSSTARSPTRSSAPVSRGRRSHCSAAR